MVSFTSLALNATSLAGHDPWLISDVAQQAGLRYVELTAGRNERAMVKCDADRDRLDEIKSILDRAGLCASTLGAHRDLSDKEHCHEFEMLIDCAAYLGCTRMTTAVPDSAEADAFFENAASLSRRASAKGITVCLETHGARFGTGCSLLKAVQNESTLKLCYDTGNVIYYGNTSPLEELPDCIKYVSHVHLKDQLGGVGVWNFPALGEGNVPLPALLRLDGWQKDVTASIELEFVPGGAPMDEVYRAARVSAAYVRQHTTV